MSIRAIIFTFGYFSFVVSAILFAESGPWGYLFEWYNHPPYFWWGDEVPDFVGGRWSFVIGLAMLIGVFLNLSRFKSQEVMKYPQSKLMVFFVLNALVVSLWAYSGSASTEIAIDHLKSMLVFYCIAKTQSNPKHLDILLLIGIVGCISWGWEATTGSYSSREVDIGAPGTFGVNTASAHIAAIVPMVAWFAATRTGWVRWICLLGMPLLINFIALGRSRGAMLALISVGLVTIVVSKGKMRLFAIFGGIIGAAVTVSLMDPEFFARMSGVSEYRSDGSAMGRIYAWQAAWDLTKDNPFGYGGESFDSGLGATRMVGTFHTTHNMFFEVLVAWGVQGLVLMYGFIFLTMRDCMYVYNKTWDRRTWPAPFETIVAISIFTGLASMLVASVFLNRYRWEYWWVYGAVAIILRNFVDNRTSDNSEEHMVVNNYVGAKSSRHR